MVTGENRAELEVFRRAQLEDTKFLPTARMFASIVFGERRVGVATLRPPLVADIDSDMPPVGEPLAKVYDADNLKLTLAWRVSIGDKYAGRKFFKARERLEHGVSDTTRAKRALPDAPEILVPPLRDEIRTATEIYETQPSSTFILKCAGIDCYQSELVHPGTWIFGLVPQKTSDAYDSLRVERHVTETTLSRVSHYVASRPNPQPELMIPFMRVSDTHSEGQREDFLGSILIPNIFPLEIEMQQLEIALRT